MPVRFDPFKHHRKSIRYADWDYRTPGFYFITICTTNRTHLFENPEFQQLAELFWQQIPNQKTTQHIKLDAFIVMPNHIHFILYIFDYPAGFTPLTAPIDFRSPPSGSIGQIVGQYKSNIARAINNLRKTKGHPVWQRGYWDHILRNEDELNRTRHYIETNPLRWAEGRDNLDTILENMIYHK